MRGQVLPTFCLSSPGWRRAFLDRPSIQVNVTSSVKNALEEGLAETVPSPLPWTPDRSSVRIVCPLSSNRWSAESDWVTKSTFTLNHILIVISTPLQWKEVSFIRSEPMAVLGGKKLGAMPNSMTASFPSGKKLKNFIHHILRPR